MRHPMWSASVCAMMLALTVGRVVEIVNDHGSGALLIWWVLASASQQVMFAAPPGGPVISFFTTLGLNCTILIPAPELALRSWEANTLCKRVTARVETDRTTASSRGIQARLSRPLIDIALTRSPPGRPSAMLSANASSDGSA